MATLESTTELGIVDNLVGYHLRRASNLIALDFASEMVGTDMRQVLFGVLSVVAANAGINQGSAGRALGIKRANMVSLVNELIASDLVCRTQSPDDRRAFALNLTPHGETVMADCLERIGKHEDRLLDNLSSAERTILISLLRRIEAKEPYVD